MEQLETLRDIVPIGLFNVHAQYTGSKLVIAIKSNANGNVQLCLITLTMDLKATEYHKYAGLYSKYRLQQRDFTNHCQERRLKTKNLPTLGRPGHTF